MNKLSPNQIRHQTEYFKQDKNKKHYNESFQTCICTEAHVLTFHNFDETNETCGSNVSTGTGR